MTKCFNINVVWSQRSPEGNATQSEYPKKTFKVVFFPSSKYNIADFLCVCCVLYRYTHAYMIELDQSKILVASVQHMQWELDGIHVLLLAILTQMREMKISVLYTWHLHCMVVEQWRIFPSVCSLVLSLTSLQREGHFLASSTVSSTW